MELDLWEGQFNLSSLQGLAEEEYGGEEEENYSRSSTCWGEDSVVTMGTVSDGGRGDLLTRSHCCRYTAGSRRREDSSRRRKAQKRGNITL